MNRLQLRLDFQEDHRLALIAELYRTPDQFYLVLDRLVCPVDKSDVFHLDGQIYLDFTPVVEDNDPGCMPLNAALGLVDEFIATYNVRELTALIMTRETIHGINKATPGQALAVLRRIYEKARVVCPFVTQPFIE